MVTEAETSADSKFRVGSFDEACELYNRALSSLDASQHSERIELLQKLGASQQGAGHYQESIGTYELLLKMQDENGSPEADKIASHLKLAKTHDLCDQPREAEVQFKTAYKLAKSLLPPKHALRRSVFAGYADWLKETGTDASLLAILRNELKAMAEATAQAETKTKTEPDAQTQTEEPEEEQTADYPVIKNSATGQTEGTSSTQAVLVSRGEAAKPLRTPTQTAPAPVAADEEPAKTSALHSQILELEAAVADLLSEEIEAEISDDDLLSKGLEALSEETASKAARAEDRASGRASIPLAAIGSGKAASSEKDWSDLPIKSQTAMRRSARSFFRDGTKSTAELDKALEEAQTSPKRFLTAIPLVICVALFGLFVTAVVNEPASKELPPVFRALVGKTFVTSDGALSLAASTGGFTIMGHGLKKNVKPMIWKGSLSDELRLLRGEYNNCIWIIPFEHGIQDLNGLKFWDETSAESKTIKAMTTIAAGAQSYYQNIGRYPTPAEAKTLFTYRNPCTDTVEPIAAYSETSYFANAATRDEKLQNRIYSGEYFPKENSARPGSVAMLSIINKRTGLVELPNQPIECQIAYLHAFDPNGQIMKRPSSDKAFVISLFKGTSDKIEDKAIVERFANASLCVSPAIPPSGILILLKYIGCILLVVALAAYLIWIKVSADRDGLTG